MSNPFRIVIRGASDDAQIKVVGGELVSDAENPGAVHMGSNERPLFCSAGLIGTDPKASNFNTLTGQNAAWIEKTTGIKGV